MKSIQEIFFNKRVALVHDWLVTMRGGEKVFEILCELFPNADVFTLVHKKGTTTPSIERMNIKTSILQHLPLGKEKYQYYLPAFPLIIKQFDLSEYDLVISSSHAVAKAVRTNPDALHICYCYTPMRYIWDQYEDYFGVEKASLITRSIMKICVNYLRNWDKKSAQNVHHFVSISKNVQERIHRIYERNSTVIYPPVDVNTFEISTRNDGYYLIVSALVPYKRVDLAVAAFNKNGKRLIVIGNGTELQRLQSIAKKNVEFLGWRNDNELRTYYSGCTALIFPGEEDFGIVPVEAMACGKPVIAYAKGGALETVVDGFTGIHFHQQTIENLTQAINKSETIAFDAAKIRKHAEQFDRKIFTQRVEQFITGQWKEKHP